MKLFKLLLPFLLFFYNLQAQKEDLPIVPNVYSNIYVNDQGKYFLLAGSDTLYEKETTPFFTLNQAIGITSGTSQGLYFDFQAPSLNGTLYFGLIPYGDSKHPQPVYFRRVVPIYQGKTSIPIKSYLSGVYDMFLLKKGKSY